MGKSVVLKDSDHRPMGYARMVDGGVVCRAQLDAPAELAVLFCDGAERIFALDGMREQLFPCEGKQLRGCYVFRGDVLLLVSDEAMHREFARHACRIQKSEEPKPALQTNEQQQRREARQAESREEKPAQKPGKGQREKLLPQRRWPPPPCWETACYRGGCWQEQPLPASISERHGDRM